MMQKCFWKGLWDMLDIRCNKVLEDVMRQSRLLISKITDVLSLRDTLVFVRSTCISNGK